MKERPILMSAPMVRAILSGAKSQTRRVVKMFSTCTPEFDEASGLWEIFNGDEVMAALRCPYGTPGEKLWVREAWARDDEDGALFYRADVGSGNGADDWERNRLDGVARYRWRPSIHMRRQYSRITLEVTDVCVERLQGISEADAVAEGAGPVLVPPDGGSAPHVEGYRALWDRLNGPGSWDANPWVWCVSFKRLDSEGEQQ